MKAAVFVSAGLGDALLLVPLIKELKKNGASVSGIFTSKFHCEELFFGTEVFDEIIVAIKKNAVLSAVKNFRKFDVAYLNFFAATKKNILLAKSISKKIITNNPQFTSFIEPKKNIHDALQNLRLLDASYDASVLNEEMFRVNFPKTKISRQKFPDEIFLFDQKYFAVQISSGNNIQKYKNWPVEHWISFLKNASEKFPKHHFLLLGDENEKEIARQISNEKIPNVLSVVGKTKIAEVIEFIRHSELFIGLDGGLMHIAAALGKLTFTLWGASDFNLYGYEKINPKKHKIVYQKISCRPCNSWLNPNVSRVKNPNDCPDFICMKNLKPDFIFSEFQKFISL